MAITRKDADRIRYARKKADVNVIDFNDWLKKEHGCKLSELDPEKVDDVIAGIATIKQEPEEAAPEEEAPEPAVEAEESPPSPTVADDEVVEKAEDVTLRAEAQSPDSQNTYDFDPDTLTPEQRKKHIPEITEEVWESDVRAAEEIAEQKAALKVLGLGNAGRLPYVLFHFSNPWNVPRLAELMIFFARKKIRVHVHYEFSMREESVSLQESEAIRKLKNIKYIHKHRSANDGKEDILIVDDPTLAAHDRYTAPLRFGVQTGISRMTSSLVAGIKRLTQYYSWSKQDKADLKRAGVSGSLLTASGSPWLSYLSRMAKKGDFFDAGTAVLYPPLGHHSCKAYWRASGLIGVLDQMKCKLIIIRQNRRDPNWLPEKFRMMDYLEPLNAADEVPRYCIAPPNIPLLEPAALEIPTLRLKAGQSISRKLLEGCVPENLPDRYTSLDASFSIFRNTMRRFYAQWPR